MPQFLLKARWFFWWRNLRLKGSKAAEFPGELPNQILFAQISVKNQHEESESNLPNQHRRMSGMVGMVGMVLPCCSMCGTGWSGRSGWFGCAASCVGPGWSGWSGWSGWQVRIRLRAWNPSTTRLTRFRFYHSDFDNTRISKKNLKNSPTNIAPTNVTQILRPAHSKVVSSSLPSPNSWQHCHVFLDAQDRQSAGRRCLHSSRCGGWFDDVGEAS